MSTTNRLAGAANGLQRGTRAVGRGLTRVGNATGSLLRRAVAPVAHFAGNRMAAHADRLGARANAVEDHSEQLHATATEMHQTADQHLVEAHDLRQGALQNRDAARQTGLIRRLNPLSRQGRVARSIIRNSRQDLREARQMRSAAIGLHGVANSADHESDQLHNRAERTMGRANNAADRAESLQQFNRGGSPAALEAGAEQAPQGEPAEGAAVRAPQLRDARGRFTSAAAAPASPAVQARPAILRDTRGRFASALSARPGQARDARGRFVGASARQGRDARGRFLPFGAAQN